MKKEENIAPFFRRFMAFIIDVFYILLIFLGLNIIGKNVNENKLKKSAKSIVSIPNSLSESIELSKQNDPDIIIAKL